MKFRTELLLNTNKFKIDYSHNILLLGSCFTDNIGQKLFDRKFKSISNPFGVLFNPFSISNLVNKALSDQQLNIELIASLNNLWHSFELHGDFSNNSKETLITNGNNAITNTKKQIENASYLFITFGTAWIYEHKTSRHIVANCHKFSNNLFDRSKLSVAEIVTEWDHTIRNIIDSNPKIKIVFTVSPIRHLKDGFHENQLSKATLHLAIDELIKLYPQNCSYFPSYELIVDDLRDYRFYEEDLVHISTEGINYLFEKFQDHYFDKSTIQLSKQLLKITMATKHRLINNSLEDTKGFAQNMLEKIKQLHTEHPDIDLNTEIEYFTQILE